MPAITNVTELQAMNLNLAGNYWLANDINAAITSTWNAGAGFIPIGSSITRFTGTFDGKNHSITDLYINRAGNDSQALFGQTRGSTIRNVSLVNVTVVGRDNVGGLIGSIYGDPDPCTISNCNSSGSVTGNIFNVGGLIGAANDATISGCHSSCSVASASILGFVGGLIGSATWELIGTISESYATGTVQSKYYGGGLIGGSIDYPISQCYATGNVSDNPATFGPHLGGLIGNLESGSLLDCFARGHISSTYVGSGYIGGLVGDIDAGTVDNVYSTGLITVASPAGKNIGGLIGLKDITVVVSSSFWDTQTSGTIVSDGGTGKTTAQMKTKATFTAAGWDFIIIWFINGITNDGYPFFFAMPPEPLPDAPRTTVLVQDKITLEAVRNVEMAAGGRFYVDEDGKATYKSRHARNP